MATRTVPWSRRRSRARASYAQSSFPRRRESSSQKSTIPKGVYKTRLGSILFSVGWRNDKAYLHPSWGSLDDCEESRSSCSFRVLQSLLCHKCLGRRHCPAADRRGDRGCRSHPRARGNRHERRGKGACLCMGRLQAEHRYSRRKHAAPSVGAGLRFSVCGACIARAKRRWRRSRAVRRTKGRSFPTITEFVLAQPGPVRDGGAIRRRW